MGSLLKTTFRRPRLAIYPGRGDRAGSSISSLPELIEFNARENPNHTFCLQAEVNRNTGAQGGNAKYVAHSITMADLASAVDVCIVWIRSTVPSGSSTDFTTNKNDKKGPVALFMESSVGLFIYLAALLKMGVPVLLLSARLSPSSVKHLLSEAGARALLVTERTKLSLERESDDVIGGLVAAPYASLFDDGSAEPKRTGVANSEGDDVQYQVSQYPLILHSSGTTGMPKLIPVSGIYPITYATCHEFPENLPVDWVNLSTLPIYHGFGLLAPCLSLSVGLTCCFPPASIIPGARSTLDLLSICSARSLMTVPSIIEDAVAADNEALRRLAELHFVAVGGGALNSSTGERLAARHVPLLNHYGVTELGPLASIFCPGPDYDWHFLRLRNDMGLQLHPLESQDPADAGERFKLVGIPVGSDMAFEVQDETIRRSDEVPGRMEIQLLGRRDDVVVLKTGEKVLARRLEDALAADQHVKTAVCLGSGRFEVVILVEPSASTATDLAEIREYVWGLVQAINPELDQHARISSPDSIIIKPPSKTIPRSDKGSVMRNETHRVFRDEVEAAYGALELSSWGSAVLEPSTMEGTLRGMLASVAEDRLRVNDMHTNQDFFERGMDSLLAARLGRLVNAAVQTTLAIKARPASPKLSAEFIYQHPSLRLISSAITRLVSGEHESTGGNGDVGIWMKAMLDEFSTGADLRPEAHIHPVVSPKKTVLLTGSTGNLGAHLLGSLVRYASVDRVICLNRTPASSNSNSQTNAGVLMLQRQRTALHRAGIRLDQTAWQKIELVDSGVGVKYLDNLSLERRNAVTHIVHLAWPMDFNRTLNSFRPHVETLIALQILAVSAYKHRRTEQHDAAKTRLLFTSSIAVARYYPSNVVPEGLDVKGGDDPSIVTPMGYAEAKWVCERLLARMSRAELEALTVRVGQLSGPTHDGVWKTDEHIPAMLRASQAVGVFPKLEGTMSWLPVDYAARALAEMLFHPRPLTPAQRLMHLENPVRQPSGDFGTIAMAALGMSSEKLVPFAEWLRRVTEAGCVPSLEQFFQDDFLALGHGGVILDTKEARAVSRTLRGTGDVRAELLREYVRRWKTEGFLQ